MEIATAAKDAQRSLAEDGSKMPKKYNYRYFGDSWRQAAYLVAGIAIIVSIILGFSLGKYRPELPYIVPSGNATRLSGSTWTLFNQPWVLPRGPSASLTDTILGLGIILALVPVSYISWNNYRYVKLVEKNIPRFLRDVLESTDSGLILPQALIQASASDYGPISREIGIAMTKFSLGYDLRESIMEACRKLKHPYMIQVGLIIVEAYSAGGKMHDVLNSSVVLFNGLDQYNDEKQSELRPYTQLVYISVVIFLLIALIIVSQFIGPLTSLSSTSSQVSPASANGGLGASSRFNFAAGLTKLSPVYFESIFFFAGVFESIFGGIVAGKIVNGSAAAGLRHSLTLLGITVFIFNAPIIGIFSVL